MKTCPNCGTEARDTAETCTICSYEFPAGAPAPQHVRGVWHRPNGGTIMQLATVAAVIALLCLILGFFAPDVRQTSVSGEYEGAAWKWTLIAFGSGLLNFAVLLWGIGIIVRAIYFLSGEDTKEAP
ncbi:MAG TPA: zinc ribbon domain-containing protein [Allosphingosinicella sp.]|jgi:hypothetical protein